MFPVPLFIIGPNQKQPNVPWQVNIDKLQYFYSWEYYEAMKGNNIWNTQ